MKKRFAKKIALFGLMGVALTAGLVDAQSKKLTAVAASLGSLGNPFFVRMGQGVTEQAKAIGGAGVKVYVDSADYDLSKQSAQIDNYIANKVEILVLNAVDPKGMVSAVKRAKAAGITVVGADVGVDEGADAIITSNNVQAGELACQFIVDRLKGVGNVVILNGPPVTAVTDRVKGCKAVFAKARGIRILSDNQNAEGNRDGGLRVMQGLLTANRKIDAVFAINDPTGLGAELAIKQARREKEMFITGVDGAPDAEVALKDKTSIYLASAAQDPYTMAAEAVKIGQEIRDGKRKSEGKTILVPVKLITRDNIASYKGWK
jgi:ribose transport system substrate-binding protein